MQRWLGPHADRLFAAFRFVTGLLFAFHGAQKFGLLGGQAVTSQPLMLAAAVIELVGGILIAIGLFTTWAAFVASGEMAVAYFMVHQPQGTWPIQNKGELAALYCFAFLYVAARGPGPFSADAARRGRR
jgi:putative oxidoreductase